MVAQDYNTSTRETESGRRLWLDGQPALSTWRVQVRKRPCLKTKQTRWRAPKQQHLELNSGLNTCPTYTNTYIHTSERKTSLLCLDYNSLIPPFPEITIILNFIVLLPVVLAFSNFVCLSNVCCLFWCKWAHPVLSCLYLCSIYLQNDYIDVRGEAPSLLFGSVVGLDDTWSTHAWGSVDLFSGCLLFYE